MSVIIVNWNGIDVIGQCLSSLKKQNYKNIEIIVVDNDSQDGSKELVSKKYKDIKLVNNKKNEGYAGGNNIGVKFAMGEYILLFNSDAIMTPNAILHLVRYLNQNPHVGVVQPKIIYKGNSEYKDGVLNSIGCYFTNTGFLYYPGYGKDASLKKYNVESAIFSAYGACMLIRHSLIKQIGLFDDDFFVYFEESDFCIRAWLSGSEVWYTPSAEVYHLGGVSSRKFGSAKVSYHSYKNRIACYIKNMEIINLLKILVLLIPLTEIASILFLLTGKFDYFLAIQKAVFWNVLNLKNNLSKRTYINNKIRKVPDTSFLFQTTGNVRFSYFYYLFTGLQYYKD